MDTANRIYASSPESPDLPSRAAGPLDSIHMSPHERRQAELDMRTAAGLVDLLFGVAAGWQGLVRRLRVVH